MAEASEHPVPWVFFDLWNGTSTTSTTPLRPTRMFVTISLSSSFTATLPCFVSGRCPPLSRTYSGPSSRIEAASCLSPWRSCTSGGVLPASRMIRFASGMLGVTRYATGRSSWISVFIAASGRSCEPLVETITYSARMSTSLENTGKGMSTHWVNHRLCDVVVTQRLRDQRHRRCRRKHTFDIHQHTLSTSSKSLFYTSFDNIDTNIFHNSLDLLLYECRRGFVNPIDALSVLSSQSSRRGHGIATMCRDDFLVGFEAPARFAVSAMCLPSHLSKRKSFPPQRSTHAPPELSDPAITRMRFMIDEERTLWIDVSMAI
jgi:hypothetical protein